MHEQRLIDREENSEKEFKRIYRTKRGSVGLDN